MNINQKFQWQNIIIYCILAFALFWLPYFGYTFADKLGYETGYWEIALGILGPFSPLIAAILVRTVISREGFRDARLSFLNVPWYYWAIAIMLPFIWNTVQDILYILFGFASMNWSKATMGLYRIPINLVAGLFIFIGEEFGWRSYLLEKLKPLGRWRALLISGVIWSVWHIPALIITSDASPYSKEINLLGILLSLFIFVLMGFIVGWLYLESKSVWPCVVLHAYNNLISLKLLSEAWSVESETSMFQTALIAIGPILLIWLIICWKGGFRKLIND